MSFVSDVQKIRASARQKIARGPVTQDYKLDLDQVVGVLNEALATEIMCVLRYRFHQIAVTGIHSAGVAALFKHHAEEEQMHADMLAARIKQLGDRPEMNPAVVAQRAYTEYREGESLEGMLREDLVAERIVIEAYREMVHFFNEKDPTSRRMIEKILEDEEEHADDLADLLFATNPQAGEDTRRLYFAEELAGQAGAGQVVRE